MMSRKGSSSQLGSARYGKDFKATVAAFNSRKEFMSRGTSRQQTKELQ